MLELKNVTKSYPGSGSAKPALRAVDLRVEEGEFVAIIGRSGAGKSTLIRCINRLVEPDGGRIVWKGRALTGLSTSELRLARSDIGMIFQHFQLLPRLSVLTNVIAGRFATMPRWRSLLGLYAKKDREDALSALRDVGIEALAGRRVEALSGGQQQRVAIARVLMQRPTLLLADEPISNLDEITAKRIMSLIAELHRRFGLTVVLNLHDLSMAKAFATRIIGLTEGSVTFDGTPEQLGDSELAAVYPPDEEEE